LSVADAADIPAPPAPATLDTVSALLAKLVTIAEAQAAELVDANVAAAICGIKRSRFYGLVTSGAAPAPLKLGAKLKRWRRAELSAWIAAGCPAASVWRVRQSAKAASEKFGAMRATG
jgi:predicted DNA-binding transcriptional regulator AlpA